MSDEAEIEEGEEFEFEAWEPEPLVLETPVGAIVIPDLAALTESLGGEVLAYQANEGGLFYLTTQRRWVNVEAQLGPRAVTKN